MEISGSVLKELITASATGIGFAVAKAFLDSGAEVHICDIDSEKLGKCTSSLVGASLTCADVSDPAEVDKLFEDVVSQLNGLDVLINNVGIAGPKYVIFCRSFGVSHAVAVCSLKMGCHRPDKNHGHGTGRVRYPC